MTSQSHADLQSNQPMLVCRTTDFQTLNTHFYTVWLYNDIRSSHYANFWMDPSLIFHHVFHNPLGFAPPSTAHHDSAYSLKWKDFLIYGLTHPPKILPRQSRTSYRSFWPQYETTHCTDDGKNCSSLSLNN